MQATGKNVKKYLIKVGYVVMFFLITIAGLLLLSGNVLFWAIGFIVEYKSEIGLIALGISLLFLAYKAYGFTKRTANPWQRIQRNLKKNLIILFSIAFSIYGCMALFVTIFPTEYNRCDYYNEELKGGVKEYQGRKLKVNLCGTGGYENRFYYKADEIRLQVFNEKGDLIALRHFKVDWRTNFPRMLEYHPDHIAYFDISSEEDFEKTLTMPPTVLDWIRARLPLFN